MTKLDNYGYENSRLGDTSWLFGKGGELWSKFYRNIAYTAGNTAVKKCEEGTDYGTH